MEFHATIYFISWNVTDFVFIQKCHEYRERNCKRISSDLGPRGEATTLNLTDLAIKCLLTFDYLSFGDNKPGLNPFYRNSVTVT